MQVTTIGLDIAKNVFREPSDLLCEAVSRPPQKTVEQQDLQCLQRVSQRSDRLLDATLQPDSRSLRFFAEGLIVALLPLLC